MLQTKFSSVIRCLTKQSRQTWQCRLLSSSSTNSQKVSVDTGDDRISVVSLNRPPVNSLNLEFMEDIIAALDQVEKDSKGMILTSANKSIFCAGLDLKEMYQPDEARLRKFWHTLQEVWLRLYTLKVPLASAINGHAPAAGTLMATCSDYRVMVGSNPKFTMGLNEAKFGLVAPFWFMDAFIAVVGQRVGDYSLLTGKLYNVEESAKIGLIDEVVGTKEEAIERCAYHIKQMSACKPMAWHMTKLQTRDAFIHRLKMNRQDDVNNFVALVTQDHLQKDLGAYIASLSGGGGKK